MLINCPKCGFSQPKDRYCASCGIDMELYRPVQPTLSSQFFKSPFFYLAVLAITVISIVTYIQKRDKNHELSERARLLRSGPVIVEQGGALPTPAQPTAAAEGNDASTSTPAPAAVGSMAASSAHSSGEPSAEMRTAGVESSSKSVPAPPESRPAGTPQAERRISMVASYVEISRNVLSVLQEEARSSGQFVDFGDFKAGAIPNLRQKMRSLNVLQKIEKTFDSKAMQQQWFVGTKTSDEQDVGLTTLVILDPSSNENRIKGEVELMRSFYESAPNEGLPPVKRSSAITSFQLPPQWGWMISLDLPNFEQTPDEGLAPIGLLRLFRSSSFKNRQTTFTLFLEFDTRTP